MVRTRSESGKMVEQNGDEKGLPFEYSGSKGTQLSKGKGGRKRRGATEAPLAAVQTKKMKRAGELKRKAKGRKKWEKLEEDERKKELKERNGTQSVQEKNDIGKNVHKKKNDGFEGDRDIGEVKCESWTVEDTAVCKVNVKKEQESMKKVGVHVSISGGLHNSIQNALDMNARSFGLFLRNQRQWAAKPLQEEEAERFKQAFKEAKFSPGSILPHGIYLMNCASPDDDTLSKSRDALIDELKRCEKLGLALYNFHPGSTCGKITVEEGIERIAESINAAHKETKYVITLIENMCCQGHTIGGKFEELKSIIDKVEDKTRIGVCFDTCHAFAAGYDITNKETLNHTMEIFENVIGIEYLKAVHLNDSKGDCGCHLDRHENIGKGKIGPKGFRALMNDARFNNIPMILETPECDYSKEIERLYSLVSK